MDIIRLVIIRPHKVDLVEVHYLVSLKHIVICLCLIIEMLGCLKLQGILVSVEQLLVFL